MMTAQCVLGVFLFALLILDAHGFPAKGPKSQSNQGQSSSGQNAGGNFASNQGAATGRYAPMYSASRDLPWPGPFVKPAPGSFVQSAPAPESLSSTIPEAEYPDGSGFVPGQASYPAQAGYPASVLVIPVQAGYDASSTQTEGSQSNLPETKWTVPPNVFSEEGLANMESFGPSSSIPPPPPPPPPGPVLQSGETSSVLKEAELGNYQHETEEFGYPAAAMGSGQRLPSNALPYFSVGGFWGHPYLYQLPNSYPNFDYRLLYGMYPPGTYSTFSKNQEKGNDYYQNIHYLKEHGSDNPNAPNVPESPGSGQQQKIFSRTL